MIGSGANGAGCAGCAGQCCRKYFVGITVRDIQTLAAGTGMHPSDFVMLRDTDKDGFRLGPDGPAKQISLLRRPKTGACVFLMEIAAGRARCGVYAHRPLVCSTFPLSLQRGVVTTREDTVCGPDAWNLATMDLPAFRRDLTDDRSARAEHRQVMRAWNKVVDDRRWQATPHDLYEYLLSTRLETAPQAHKS